MPRRLNLTRDEALAVRAAIISVRFAGGEVQFAFDNSIDVFISERGWLTVRDGPNGFEEHKDLHEFELAYCLDGSPPHLLPILREMESVCDTYVGYANEEGNDSEQAKWAALRDKCRIAIAASAG